MLRRKILWDHGLLYDEKFRHAEDYELWTRILNITKGYNFQFPLVKYRVSQASISKVHAKEQEKTANLVSCSQLIRYGEEFDSTWESKCIMLGYFPQGISGESPLFPGGRTEQMVLGN